MEVRHQSCISSPQQNFIVVADGSLNEDGRPVLVLAKKVAFTSSEYSAVARHLQSNPNLVWLNPPPEYVRAQVLPPAAKAFQELIQSNNPQQFARSYAYKIGR